MAEDVGRGAASDDTVRTHTTQIKLFLKWCHQCAIAPLSVSKLDVKAYRRALHEQGHKNSTIALKLSAVRRLYEGAIEAGLIATNPALVNGYLSESGLKEKDNQTISVHSLRHTAGTLALRGGAELRQVQDLLGHADIRTTSLYIHVGDRWDNNPAKFWR